MYPGRDARACRRCAHAGLKLACLTNKPTAFARPLLEAKGLAGFFNEVFGGDAFERKKPDPLPLLKTCEALGQRPARTLMIGDSSNDAQAARAAGCPVLLVTYGYNHGEPVRAVDADGYASTRWPTWRPLLAAHAQAGLPSSASLSFQSAGLGPQPDAHQRVEEFRLLEGLALRHALDGDDRAGAGNPVDGEGVAGTELLVIREDLAHAHQAGDQLGKCALVHVVLHAAREQLAQFGRVDLAQHGDAHALGAGRGQHLFGVPAFFGRYRPAA